MFSSRVPKKTSAKILDQEQLLNFFNSLIERPDGCCYCKQADYATEDFKKSLCLLNLGVNVSLAFEGGYDAGPNGCSDGQPVLKICGNLFSIANQMDTKFNSQHFHNAVLFKKEIKTLDKEQMLDFFDSIQERSDGSCYCRKTDYTTDSFMNSLNYLDSRVNASKTVEGSYSLNYCTYSDGEDVLIIPMNKYDLGIIMDSHADNLPVLGALNR